MMLIVPIGRIEGRVVEEIRAHLKTLFHEEVSPGSPLPFPDYAYNVQRRQYNSTLILGSLHLLAESGKYGKVLGVFDHDMYAQGLNFVFGEATGRAALISIARLKQSFYGLPEDEDLFLRRVRTEAVHELLHTYGMGHCKNPHCVMFFSNSIEDTDRKGFEPCPRCSARLGHKR